MIDEEGIRWWSVRKWERVCWRINLWVVLVGCPVMMAVLVLTGGIPIPAGVVVGAYGIIMLWRLGRVAVLAVAVLPDRVLVRRALSLGVEEVPVEAIRRCALQHYLVQYIIVYQRKWWLPPLYLPSGRFPPIGYSPRVWPDLVAALRAVFEPLGKWEERPWWRVRPWI